MKKSITQLTLLIAIVIIPLAMGVSACGDSRTSQGKNGGKPDTASGEPAPYVIDYYMLANSASPDVNIVMDEINKITLPKFNAKVNITMIDWNDWFSKVNGDIRAGSKVDVVFTADWHQYMDSIAGDYFIPLNDLLDEYGAPTKAQLGETFISGCKVDGVLYGIPTDKELAVNGGFVYNKTLLDKYGLKVNKNWKSLRDWEPLLKVIKENEPQVCPLFVYGIWCHPNLIYYLPCELVFDGDKNNDVIQWAYDNPAYMNELRTARDFFLKGYIPHEMAGMLETDVMSWANRLIAKGNFFLTTLPLKPGKGKSTELMATLEVPGIEYDEFETFPLLVNTRHCGGSMLAISKTSKDPVKAMQFINEMHTNPQLTNLLAWGIEGKHYTVVSENPKRVQPVENNNWTPSVLVWTFGNVFNVHLSAVEPKDKYNLLASTKVGIPQHIANGYRFNPAKHQDIITVINTISDEYAIPIRIGAVDPDKSVAAMRAEMNAAGFRELKEAIDADFRRWLKEARRP